MKLRSAVGAALGAIGLATAANRALGARVGELGPPLSGESGTYRWRGFDVAYTEAGDPDDPDVLCLHGLNATGSSYEFRGIFEDLAEDHHVVAPDLPGFGRSDRPPLLYSGSLYTTFVEDFAEDVTEDATVVAASHSGAYAAVAAQSVDFGELLLVCPTAESMPGRRVWLRSLLRSPVVGEAIFGLATSKRAIRYFNADHGYYDESNLTADRIDYQWRTAHQPGARFAASSFLSGFLDLDADLAEVLADLDEPVTLVWGQQASVTPLSTGRDLAAAADARLVVFDQSDVQPHVEHPEQFVRQVVRGDATDAAAIETEDVSDAENPTTGDD